MKKTSTHRSVQDKMNERKLRILTGQRQDLERELETLQREIESLVRYYVSQSSYQ